MFFSDDWYTKYLLPGLITYNGDVYVNKETGKPFPLHIQIEIEFLSMRGYFMRKEDALILTTSGLRLMDIIS